MVRFLLTPQEALTAQGGYGQTERILLHPYAATLRVSLLSFRIGSVKCIVLSATEILGTPRLHLMSGENIIRTRDSWTPTSADILEGRTRDSWTPTSFDLTS